MGETIRRRITGGNAPVQQGGSDNQEMAIYGDRLRELMQARGESQSSLAVRARVSQPTIQRILAGEIKNPTGDTLRKLASALDVEVSALATHRPGLLSVQSPEPPVYQMPLVDLLDRLCTILDAQPAVRAEAIALVARYLERPDARPQVAQAIHALVSPARR